MLPKGDHGFKWGGAAYAGGRGKKKALLWGLRPDLEVDCKDACELLKGMKPTRSLETQGAVKEPLRRKNKAVRCQN